jgi:hypothetical protein
LDDADGGVCFYYRRRSGGLGAFSQWGFSAAAFSALPAAARLSAVLRAATAAGGGGAFSAVVPLVRAAGWKLFPAVVVMRAAGRSDVSVVFIDFGRSYTLSQHAVCFQRRPDAAGMMPAVPPPGVTVGSASLDRECILALFQEALHAHWGGGAPLLPSSLTRSLPVVRCAAGGFQLPGGFARLSAESEQLVVAGLHQVCSVGGTDGVLVPVALSAAGGALFVAVVRRIRAVSLSLVWLNAQGGGVVEAAPFQGLPHDLAAASPFMDGIQFVVAEEGAREDIAAMFFQVAHDVWRERFASLAFVQRANLLDGVRFLVKGYHPHAPVVAPAANNALIPFADGLGCWVELAIKICLTDSNHAALLIPCIPNTKEMVVVVRRGGCKFLALHLTADGVSPMAVRAVDCSGFAASPIDCMVHGAALEVADVRRLIDREVFAHWKERSRVNPFNWPERRAAFAMGAVPRLASASVLLGLPPSVVGMIGRLVV